MKSETARVEHRFFFPLKDFVQIKRRINANRLLKQLTFPRQVTETVYFTLGDENYSVPKEYYVRMRRYVSDPSNIIILDSSSAFLEIKTKDNNNSANFKSRFEIEAKRGVELLTKPEQRPNSCVPLFLPPLFPTAATQTERFHWNLEDKLRITLDKDVFFFGFSGADWFVGYPMGSLGEGKLELKSETEEDFTYLEREILRGVSGRIEQPFYLERRMRECHTSWLATLITQSR